jgi:hypothetical protein
MTCVQAELAPSTNYFLALDAKEFALAARIAAACLSDCPSRVHATWTARLYFACEGLVSKPRMKIDMP